MTPDKRDLKGFVRFDASGRIVAGSLILRKKMPKVGKWQEVPAYECCNPVITNTTTTTTTAIPIPENICVSGFVENSGFNGTYTYVGLADGKPHYEKDGELYDIYWETDRWWIGDVAYSVDDVANATLVTLWISDPADGDISVTEGACP